MGGRLCSRSQDDSLGSDAEIVDRVLEPEMLMGIASKAEEPVTLDDFTTRYWKTGFAKLRMEIDSSKPLTPEVSIHG